MVSGHLAVKKNRWYAILCLRHPDGRRYDKWIATGLSYPGNKRKAEAMLIELRRQHFNSHIWNAATLLSEYIPDWLKTRQKEISETTYSSYLQIANEIVRYFLNQDVRLSQISPHHIETYYQTLYERGLKSNSVLHHHALLHKALADASRKGLIAENPMEKVQRPAKGSYIPHPYTAEEMRTLFAALQGHYMEVPIKLAAYYGLRRSEVLGLRWQAIDFEQETISVEHILYARQRGLPDGVIRRDYLLRSIVQPFLTMLGMSVSLCVGGSVVIEKIFSIGGMGSLLTEAVYTLDYPLMQGILFVTTCIMVLSILLTDFLCLLLDPKRRSEGRT